jgi:CRISPR-associated endoribonuclease Cas6
MHYFELICTAYIKRDISFRDSFEIISKYISFSMAQINKLRELHNDNRFKFYSFSNFYPIEKSKIYKSHNSYTFKLRSPDSNFIDILSKNLRENINNPNMLIVQTEKQVVKISFINELYTITPTIITTESRLYWTMEKDGDIVKLSKQIHDNIEKKYNNFYKEKLSSRKNFIRLLALKNQKPQTIQLTRGAKKIRLFGNKFKIIPHEDTISQRLAFMALSCGLGEKNSFGGGFCIRDKTE